MKQRWRMVLIGLGVLILLMIGVGLALTRTGVPRSSTLTISVFALFMISNGLRRSAKPSLTLTVAAVGSLLCACLWFTDVVC